jgi:hypothetical protein
MELTPALKAEIDGKTYRGLLERWRNAPLGDALFQGPSGEYWAQRMAQLRDAPGGQSAHVAASKSIGWERNQ